ncbi:MAG: hypothetical protein QNJ97_21575 [Myxococcota bacterium]|nr:hypothetical protein [Myxococcota bacterium]
MTRPKQKKSPPKAPKKGKGKTKQKLDTHEDLVAHLPTILARLNEDEVLNRMVLINPLLVLEDMGYVLSRELQKHIRGTLGFPQPLVDRMVKLRARLRKEICQAVPDGTPVKIPKSPKERATLLFDTLGLGCKAKKTDALTVEQLPEYTHLHPIVPTLYELGKLERGSLTYHTRGTYEAFKAGQIHHPWIKQLHFRVED